MSKSVSELIHDGIRKAWIENNRREHKIARQMQLPLLEHIARPSGDAESRDIARRFICKARA